MDWQPLTITTMAAMLIKTLILRVKKDCNGIVKLIELGRQLRVAVMFKHALDLFHRHAHD